MARGNRLVSFHVEMPAGADVLQSHDTIDTIEKDLMREEGLIATIHYDPVVTDDAHVNELRAFLEEETARLEPEAAVHDLRIVPGAQPYERRVRPARSRRTTSPAKTSAPRAWRQRCAKRSRRNGPTISV